MSQLIRFLDSLALHNKGVLMRTTHRQQLSFPIPAVSHKHARLLASMSAILDTIPELEEQVLSDLTADGVRSDFGRDGLSAQQVLRLMVLYTMLRTTFEQLEFHLADSPTYRAFCLLGITDPPPKRAAIAANVAKLRPATLQSLHVCVVRYAVEHKLESVTAVRTDTTSVAAPIRAPLDSALLSDSVRVLARLLKRAQKWVPSQMPNHRRRVTHRSTSLRAPKVSKEDRESLYSDLMDDTKIYVEAALFAATYLEGIDDPQAYLLSRNLRIQAERALCVLDQTERRIFGGEQLPPSQKLVSIFEPHIDILCKRNSVVYGHKVCLSFGHTGLVLAAEVLRGNPADSTLTATALKQVQSNTGRTPHDAAMDRGFASKQNVVDVKELGVVRVDFGEGRGIDTQKACGNRRIRRKMRCFRAGAEGLISWLKRGLKLGESRWKGAEGFDSYVWAVIVTACIQAIARSG
jgi:IS5 family transposase